MIIARQRVALPWAAARLTPVIGPMAPAAAGLPRAPRLDLSLLWMAISGASPAGPGRNARRRGLHDDELERVRALVTLAQGGDADAFGQLYQRYVDAVYRYIYVRVGAVHVAQDLTSETFIKALRNLDGFTWQGKDIAAWFVTIARNVVNDHTTSSRFRLEVATPDMRDVDTEIDAPETEVLDRLRDRRLLQAVAQLKPEQAECVTLRFIQGLSLAETAEVMGKKDNAVKQLQLRAVRALQRALEGEDL